MPYIFFYFTKFPEIIWRCVKLFFLYTLLALSANSIFKIQLNTELLFTTMKFKRGKMLR